MIAGAPVLREPAGERTLTSGDLVCFPSGHHGAHTVKGSGRFVIFATGQHLEPWMSVYPDSGQGQRPGRHPPPQQRGRLLARRGNGRTVGGRRDRPRARWLAAAAGRERAGPTREGSVRCWAPSGSTRRWWTWSPERDLSPTTTSTDGRSGCWSWPERPACATSKVTMISSPAISCAFRKARPVLAGCSIAARKSSARCGCRRRACRPTSATRTPGNGSSTTPPGLRQNALPRARRRTRRVRGSAATTSPRRFAPAARSRRLPLATRRPPPRGRPPGSRPPGG